jgi:hypothetical protein
MVTILYRAVSLAELEDFRRFGRLRAGPSSCEGKHFACTVNAATEWGKALHGPNGYAILRVSFDDDVARDVFAWDSLDGIGPARFATIEQLEGVRAVEVIHEPSS